MRKLSQNVGIHESVLDPPHEFHLQIHEFALIKARDLPVVRVIERIITVELVRQNHRYGRQTVHRRGR